MNLDDDTKAKAIVDTLIQENRDQLALLDRVLALLERNLRRLHILNQLPDFGPSEERAKNN